MLEKLKFKFINRKKKSDAPTEDKPPKRRVLTDFGKKIVGYVKKSDRDQGEPTAQPKERDDITARKIFRKRENRSDDNLVGYVETETRTFDELPLSEVDSLVLCQMSYMDWSKCVAVESPIGELGDWYVTERLCGKMRAKPNNVRLALAARASVRYGAVKVCNFVNLIDGAREMQFSAVCFRLPTQELYIAFRGTDGSVAGWKEDFNMMYADAVPSQIMAAEYLEAFGWQSERIFVGGHSKGGNLAIYAAAHCNPAIRRRIAGVFSHDGPGFRQSMRGMQGYDEIVDKVFKTVPQGSIVGLLMEDEDPSVIVQSEGKGFAQHDPYLWKIRDGKFVAAAALNDGSLTIKRAIKGWLGNMSDLDRENFVNALFLVLKESGASSLREFTKMWVTDFPRVRAAMSSFDAPTRARVTGALGLFVSEIMRSQKDARQSAKERKDKKPPKA